MLLALVSDTTDELWAGLGGRWSFLFLTREVASTHLLPAQTILPRNTTAPGERDEEGTLMDLPQFPVDPSNSGRGFPGLTGHLPPSVNPTISHSVGKWLHASLPASKPFCCWHGVRTFWAACAFHGPAHLLCRTPSSLQRPPPVWASAPLRSPRCASVSSAWKHTLLANANPREAPLGPSNGNKVHLVYALYVFLVDRGHVLCERIT